MDDLTIQNLYKINPDDVGLIESDNSFYIPLRVTGTGESLRNDGCGVFVEDRQQSEFFTSKVLEACAHLPVTLGHPDGMLSEGGLANAPIVGNTILSYIKGDEIWAVAKIYDKSILEKLGREINSTSPGVVSVSQDRGDGVYAEKPLEINHLALVDKGHWDKTTPPFILNPFHYKGENMENTEVFKEEIVETDNDALLGNVSEEEIKEEVAETKVDATEIDDASSSEVENTDVEDEAIETEHEEEVISEVETDEDIERECLIKELRDICDEAHPALDVKMPFINERLKPEYLLKKFIKTNHFLVDEKYIELVKNDSMPKGFNKDIISSIKNKLNNLNSSYKCSKVSGWQDTNRGYKVNLDW